MTPTSLPLAQMQGQEREKTCEEEEEEDEKGRRWGGRGRGAGDGTVSTKQAGWRERPLRVIKKRMEDKGRKEWRENCERRKRKEKGRP